MYVAEAVHTPSCFLEILDYSIIIIHPIICLTTICTQPSANIYKYIISKKTTLIKITISTYHCGCFPLVLLGKVEAMMLMRRLPYVPSKNETTQMIGFKQNIFSVSLLTKETYKGLTLFSEIKNFEWYMTQ